MVVTPPSSGIRASGVALFEKSKFGECKETKLVETNKIAAYKDTVKVIAELQSPIGGKSFEDYRFEEGRSGSKDTQNHSEQDLQDEWRKGS